MSKRLKITTSLLILLVMAVFFTNTERFINSFYNGVAVWGKNVLPALFPFVLLSKLFVSIDAFSDGASKSKLLPKLFNSPKIGTYTLLLSLLCGYPIGAKVTSELHASGRLTTTQATKVASFCSTAGPVFVIGTVGVKMLHSTAAAVIILIAHILGNLINGILYRNSFVDDTPPKTELQRQDSTKGLLNTAMLDSLNSVLAVGGFVALFFMLGDMIVYYLPSWFSADGQLLTAYILGTLEMTNGCLLVAQSADLLTATILCCSIISFGGLCILMQSMVFYSKCNIDTRRIVTFKLSHSALSTIICFVIAHIFSYLSLL